jgi:hypothetical protein
MSLPSSKTWSPPHPNQKLERAFTTPKVAHPSELHSHNWAAHNPQCLSAPITPLNLVSLIKQSNKNDQKQWTCDTIGSQTESAKNNLTIIGNQDVKISAIITQNIIQRNITRTCADSYYIRQIVFRFCEGMLNYSHSRNPRCAPAQTHEQIQAPREPPN